MQHYDVTAVAWQDKGVFLLLFTNSDPGLKIRSQEKQEKAIKTLKFHVQNPS